MKIAIIGGGGRMGRWFARFLVKESMAVIIAGRDADKLRRAGRRLGVAVASDAGAVEQADVVLIAVPIDSFEPVVSQIAPHVRPEQIVVDITSVKKKPVALMHRYFKNNLILGTHPMFGPGIRGISNRNFVLTPTNEDENALAQKVKAYLVAKGVRVTLMTPGGHDEMMAVVLGLSHFVALVTADTLLDFKDLKKLVSISGKSYKLLSSLVENVLSQDPELYSAIQMSLDGVPPLEKRFQEKAAVWAAIVKNNDTAQFVARMKVLKGAFTKT